MEKKGVAVTASLVFVALLSGILLGGTVARPPPVTITSQTIVEKTVTASVKIRSGPYSAPLTGLTVEVFTPFNTRSSSSGLNLMTRRIPIPKKRTLA
jgi:hypothetical protein